MVKKYKKKNNIDIIKNALISSLENGSTVSNAVEEAKVSRAVFYQWYHRDTNFKDRVDEAQQSRIKIVEDSLYINAIKGNITAQIFFLCNRDRGNWKSLQRVEVTGENGKPIEYSEIREKFLERLAGFTTSGKEKEINTTGK